MNINVIKKEYELLMKELIRIKEHGTTQKGFGSLIEVSRLMSKIDILQILMEASKIKE